MSATQDHTATPPTAASGSSVPPSVEAAAQSAQNILAQAQQQAAPYLTKAQEIAAPYIEKGKEFTAPIIAKGGEVLNAAQARADELIKEGKANSAAAAGQTRSAADDLKQEASATTNQAAQEGSHNLEQAKEYLAGVASTVTGTLSSLSHQLNDKTATASHPGVVTQLTNAFSSAQSYINTHLPQSSTTVEEPVGTVISDVANNKADEAEIKDALRQLAGKGEETLEGAREQLEDVKRP
ncbi:hypothetical protein [Phaffia rhodozyma]|uniref:Uncharacterized protein n=1 Tax=Phaffia rhodozyma TaxID=264483 RepID=A0A0F7SGU8_PHARH|nr:hypothetical protein [Phaffia rhodozyma]